MANEQREKRTSYIIEAGADEILSMLHRADPEGLRETCNSLTKRISAARSWCENVPTVENVYKAVIDLDVEDLLTMARLLECEDLLSFFILADREVRLCASEVLLKYFASNESRKVFCRNRDSVMMSARQKRLELHELGFACLLLALN